MEFLGYDNNHSAPGHLIQYNTKPKAQSYRNDKIDSSKKQADIFKTLFTKILKTKKL